LKRGNRPPFRLGGGAQGAVEDDGDGGEQGFVGNVPAGDVDSGAEGQDE
jgi:hypothetical protein